MRCNKVEDLLPSYSEGDLPEKERELVEEHLASCARCSESAKFYERLGLLARSLFEEKFREVSEKDWERAWQGIYAEIATQQLAKPVLPRRSLLPLLRRRWLALALAGALAILLLALFSPLKGGQVPEPKGMREALKPEGVGVAKQDTPSSMKETDITADKEGMGKFLTRDMEGMAQLAARQLWEMELEGIKRAWDDRESPLLALQGALEGLGEKVDYDYLRFASGASFRFFFHRVSLGQEQEYSMAIMENAAAAYGYRSQWVLNKDLHSTLKAIEESMEDNCPVLTVGMPGSGRRGYIMIVAYNQDEGTIQVKRYGKGQSSEYTWIPISRRGWQAAFFEHQGMVKMPLFILAEKGEVPDRREVARKVLYQAIEFSKGRKNPGSGYYSGLAAYEQWIAILQEERKPEQEVTWRQAIVRVSFNPLGDIIRRNQLAEGNLILIAQELQQGEAKDELLVAADNYTTMTGRAKELQNLFRSEGIQVHQTGGCQIAELASENEVIAARAIALVQDMLAGEEAGIARLESVIRFI